MNSLEQLEALSRALSGDSDAQTIAQLEAMLAAWQDTGELPGGAGALSSGEYAALVLAAGREDLTGPSPVGTFLLMDGWLQRWVMKTRGWTSFVGTRIGV